MGEHNIAKGLNAYTEALGCIGPGGPDFPQVEAIVPAGINAKTLVSNFFTSIQTQMAADYNGRSWGNVTRIGLTDALLKVATLGLYPGAHGHVYVYPFKGVPTVVPGYKGMIALMKRVPGVAFVDANVVYEKEKGDFDYEEGTNAFLRHKRTLEADRGPIIAAWAQCRYHGTNSPQFVIMTREEINRCQTTGQPWNTHPDRMATKSAIRLLYNRVGTDDAAIHLAATLHDASLGYTAETVDMSPRQQQAPTGGPVQRPALPMVNQFNQVEPDHRHEQATG